MSLVAHYSSPSSNYSQTDMPLSATTVSRLADALKEDIIEEIYMNEKYVDVMQELIADAIDKKLGTCDQDLFFDLGMVLLDRIELK